MTFCTSSSLSGRKVQPPTPPQTDRERVYSSNQLSSQISIRQSSSNITPMSSAGGSIANSACATHQPTGSFLHSSSLSSSRYSSAPHHAKEALASHNIRLAFGDRVQWVADGLQAIGATGEQSAVSFSSLWTLIQRKQESVTTCVQADGPLAISSTTTPVKAVEKSAVRAALLILMQHSIVSVRMQRPPKSISNSPPKQPIALYRYHPEKAIHLDGCRYARYSEHVKRALDATASIVVDTLLLNGRLRTVDLVVKAVEHQQMFHQIPNQTVQHHKYTARETTVDAVCKLVKGGYLEQVKPIPRPGADPDEGEAEFDEPPLKKVKIHDPQEKGEGEDPAVVNVLRGNAQYKSILPIDAVWRVNQNMFHDSIRALCLGRLVAELYGQKIQSVSFENRGLLFSAKCDVKLIPSCCFVIIQAGSLITGALKFRASLEHSPAGIESGVRPSDVAFFTPSDVVKFLPKSVMQIMEDKAAKLGEANAIGVITRSFIELAELRHPTLVVRRLGDDLFEIAHASLLEYLRKRIVRKEEKTLLGISK